MVVEWSYLPMFRTRTQKAAGCCSVRRIWSPCLPSSHSSSCILTCWGLACRVSVWVFICPYLVHLFHSPYEPTHLLPFRCVRILSPLKSEDHACFWFCFLSHWNSGSWATNLQQGAIQTVSKTDWSHHKVSARNRTNCTYTQFIMFKNKFIEASSVFFAQNDGVLCQWSLGRVCECSWCWWNHLALSVSGQTTTRVWPSFPQSCFTCTQKQKVRNWPQSCVWLEMIHFIHLLFVVFLQVGHLAVHVWDAIWDSVQLYAVESPLCHAVCRDSRSGNNQRHLRHTILHSGS